MHLLVLAKKKRRSEVTPVSVVQNISIVNILLYQLAFGKLRRRQLKSQNTLKVISIAAQELATSLRDSNSLHYKLTSDAC